MKNKFKKILIIAFITNLTINFASTNSNIYYADNVSFARSMDSFQVSKILAKDPLKPNHLLWKKIIENNPVIGLKAEDKKVLDEYEKLIFIKADKNKSRDFDQIKTQTHFQSLEEIETKIKAQLNLDFTFDKLSSGLNFEYKKIIQEKILNFYNFIIASKLLSEKHLVKLYYFISLEATPLNDPNTLAYVYGNKKMQCATFNNSWYSSLTQEKNLLSFKNGFLSVKQSFGTFSHETAHALLNFYSLRSEERESYNTNNFQKHWDGKQACEPFLLDIFEENSFANQKKWNILSSIVDYITDKFDEIYPMASQNHYNFAYWTGLPSHYGWSDKEEYLAEGFAYLYHTPEVERNKIWEIWYDAILGNLQDSLINKFYQ